MRILQSIMCAMVLLSTTATLRAEEKGVLSTRVKSALSSESQITSEELSQKSATWIMAWRRNWDPKGDWNGTKYLCHGDSFHKHGWENPECANYLMQKIKEAHIGVLILDWTNFGNTMHTRDVVRKTAIKKDFRWVVVIDSRPQGNSGEPNPRDVPGLNEEAGEIYDFWVKDQGTRYVSIDNKPVLIIFGTEATRAKMLQKISATPAKDKTSLDRFTIQYCLAKPTGATAYAPWGHDTWGGNDKIRYAGPATLNHKPKVDKKEWATRVAWAKKATFLSIYGSYDGGDNQGWGIADTSGTDAYPEGIKFPTRKYPDTSDYYYYYTIVKDR